MPLAPCMSRASRAGCMPAYLRRAERSPGDAVARLVEAAKGALQAHRPGKPVLLGNEDLVHHDLPANGGAQRELALDLGGGQASHTLFQDEAADLARLVLSP